MTKNNKTRFSTIYTLSLFLFAISIITLIALEPGFGITNDNQDRVNKIYLGIATLAALLSLAALVLDKFYNKEDDDDDEDNVRSFFFYDNSKYRILGGKNIALAIGVWILITILILSAAGALGSSVIPITNIYSEGASTDMLANHAWWENIYNYAFKACLEDFAIFALEASIIFIVGLLLRKAFKIGKTASYAIGLLIALPVGAAIFLNAHSVAYGADQGAYAAAFTYMIIVMAANFLTGLFLSPVVHLLHNASVITFSLSIALTLAVGLYFPKKRGALQCRKKE